MRLIGASCLEIKTADGLGGEGDDFREEVVVDGCEVVGVKEVGGAKECRTLLNRGAKIE